MSQRIRPLTTEVTLNSMARKARPWVASVDDRPSGAPLTSTRSMRCWEAAGGVGRGAGVGCRACGGQPEERRISEGQSQHASTLCKHCFVRGPMMRRVQPLSTPVRAAPMPPPCVPHCSMVGADQRLWSCVTSAEGRCACDLKENVRRKHTQAPYALTSPATQCPPPWPPAPAAPPVAV